MTTARRLALAVACLVAFAASAHAQSPVGQLWPELELFWNLDSTFRLFALGQLKYQSRTNNTGGAGLHLDYMKVPNGFARIGYRYIFPINSKGQWEHRELLELTLHGGGTGLRYVNRLRLEVRDIESEWSARLRERARIEDTFHFGGVGLRPYATAEVFYDTRFHDLARIRYQAGSEFLPRGRVGVDMAYVRQDEWSGGGAPVNAFLFKLLLTY